MRLNPVILLLGVAAWLLAESQPGLPGQRIEVRSSNGPIEITGSDIDHVQVEDSSHGIVENSNGMVVVESDGAPLRLHVPRRSLLRVSTSNGAIRVSGVAGEMNLTTSNGAIIVERVSVGGIHAQTSNGPIEIGVPPGLNARLSARTSNARIHAEVDVVTKSEAEDRLEGTLGKGGPMIDLQTSNGSISLENLRGPESVTSTFVADEVK